MRWCREPVLDEYAEDGELVVLLPDRRVLALSELASAVLALLAGTAATTDEIAARVAASVAPPTGGQTVTDLESLLLQMSELGLIRAV
jgi:hypothetical protein